MPKETNFEEMSLAELEKLLDDDRAAAELVMAAEYQEDAKVEETQCSPDCKCCPMPPDPDVVAAITAEYSGYRYEDDVTTDALTTSGKSSSTLQFPDTSQWIGTGCPPTNVLRRYVSG